MLILQYKITEILECEPKVKECCEPDKNPPDTGGGDCCFDVWKAEYKNANNNLKQADAKVTHLTTLQAQVQSQRDMWKTWRDELDNACTISNTICSQLDLIINHTSRISRNIRLARRSVDLLFCMLRDFYMQIDLLKKKYDYLLNCIKCLNNPGLVAGQGIMALIDDYGTKLTAVIQTRDNLIQSVVAVISTINNLNKNIGHHGHQYGFGFILKEWKHAFNCEGKHNNDNDKKRYDAFKTDNPQQKPEGEFEDAGLEPMLKFPICDSRYYKKVDERYTHDDEELSAITNELQIETKQRDNLKALCDGLTAVMSDPNVDPSKRCATTTAAR